MKHQYDEPTMQAAIDAACSNNAHGFFMNSASLNPFSTYWPKESNARLSLLNTALDLLPDPPPPVVDGKTLGEVAVDGFRAGGEDYFPWATLPEGVRKRWRSSASAVLAAFGNKPEVIQDGGEVFEVADPYAELKAAHAAGKVIQSRGRQYAIGARPWSEWTDEPAPDWSLSNDVEYRIKPEPSTFETHGKVWTHHTPGDPMPCELNRMVEVITQKHIDDKNLHTCPHDSSYWQWNHSTKIIGWRYADDPTPEPAQPWTPKVGDVVTLRSGGPKMTVDAITGVNAFCRWFDMNGSNQLNFNLATLTPV